MSINKIQGDLDQNGVVDQKDSDLLANILSELTDSQGNISLPTGITDAEASKLNSDLKLSYNADDWDTLLNADPQTKEITNSSLQALSTTMQQNNNPIVSIDNTSWTSIFLSDLGITLSPNSTVSSTGISTSNLVPGEMTAQCFSKVFDTNNDGVISQTEAQSAEAMLQEVAASGVMGTTDLKTIFSDYANTSQFFTVDLDAYTAQQNAAAQNNTESLDTFAKNVGSDSVWNLISNLLSKNIDICTADSTTENPEIDIDKLTSFENKVSTLAQSGVMGANTSEQTAYTEFINAGFTIDTTQLAQYQDNLKAYIGADPRSTSIWELIKNLNTAKVDIGLTTTNKVVDLAKVNALVANYLSGSVAGGGAGLISKVNGVLGDTTSSSLMQGLISMALTRNSSAFSPAETRVLTYLEDATNFRRITDGGFTISASQLDTVIASQKPALLF